MPVLLPTVADLPARSGVDEPSRVHLFSSGQEAIDPLTSPSEEEIPDSGKYPDMFPLGITGVLSIRGSWTIRFDKPTYPI